MKICKIIGETFGPFKILETVRVQYENGRAITKYKVECTKCGEIMVKQLHQLKQFKGEGCLNCTEKMTRKPELTINQRNYNNYKTKIKNQTDLEFSLSFNEFDFFVTRNCFYCGSEPVFPERFKNEFKNREVENFNGIDRIDSNKGYIKDNCVSCCSICNRMKSDMTQQDFYIHINKIYKFNKSSTTSPMDVASSDGEMEGIPTDNAVDYDIV